MNASRHARFTFRVGVLVTALLGMMILSEMAATLLAAAAAGGSAILGIGGMTPVFGDGDRGGGDTTTRCGQTAAAGAEGAEMAVTRVMEGMAVAVVVDREFLIAPSQVAE